MGRTRQQLRQNNQHGIPKLAQQAIAAEERPRSSGTSPFTKLGSIRGTGQRYHVAGEFLGGNFLDREQKIQL